MAMDVASGVLDDPDFLVDISLKRQVAGSYVNGLFVEGFETSSGFQGSIQPATADDFQNMSEGDRVSGAQVLFTKTLLRGSKDNTKADFLTFNSLDWKVVAVEDWSHHGYYKAMIVRQGG